MTVDSVEVIAFIVADAEAGTRLDRLIADRAGRSRAKLGLRAVVLDGQPARPQDRPRAGAHVEARIDVGETPRPAATAVDYDIVYVDEHLVVVDKPAGIPVHPPRSAPARASLIGALADRFPEITELSEVGAEERPGVVHRIDSDTSGLVIVARSARAFAQLSEMVVGHEIRRRYTALVSGRFDVPAGSVDAPIARRPGSRTFRVDASGRRAVTRYEVMARWDRPPVSLLSVSLVTGRTHQIRVHMTSIGHPVVGDRAYRGQMILGLERQFLHAAELGFIHPLTGDRVEFRAPLPDDLRDALAAAGPPSDGSADESAPSGPL